MIQKHIEYMDKLLSYCNLHNCGCSSCALNWWCNQHSIWNCNFAEAATAVALIKIEEEKRNGIKPINILEYEFNISEDEIETVNCVEGDCPSCGEVVELGDNYCRKCGVKIDWSDYD